MTTTGAESSSPGGPARSPRAVVVAAWAAAAAVAVLMLGPMFASVFRPPPGSHRDFAQEWLSARNFWAGDPVYLPTGESLRRRTGRDDPALTEGRPLNAHPPVAVLAALPFGLIPDYPAAHFAWNVVTFSLFLVGVCVVARELGAIRWWSIFPAVVLLLACNAVVGHLSEGQLNFPVAFLLAIGWAADRRGYRTGAGVAVGLAAALKLFPALVIVYFVAARAWRQAAVAVAVAAATNGVALGVFGREAFATYLRDILPTLDVFRRSWGNVSATGYWTRVGSAAGVPGLGRLAAVACQLAVAAAIVRAGWRATTPDARDRGFALAVAGMPLASPVAWAHYFVILVLPLLLLWQRLPPGWRRVVFFAAVVLLLLPERLFPEWYAALVPGSARTVAGLANALPPPPRDVSLCAVGLGVPFLALASVFALLATVGAGHATPSNNPAATGAGGDSTAGGGKNPASAS